MGTKPLPRNGKRINTIGRLLAVSTLLLTRPKATDNQIMAMETRTRSANVAAHSTKPAVGRKPTAIATAMTTTRLTIV
ncbi:hypothetical protein RE2895_54950 [Rhodococcus erythropolis]|nr:hypothetical protein RE2895_54950 [Rhodococcus erythropolis]